MEVTGRMKAIARDLALEARRSGCDFAKVTFSAEEFGGGADRVRVYIIDKENKGTPWEEEL